METLDPFALLGVTIESTPEEAKAAFRAIALIVHPDKGGRADDMKMLMKSYKFVMKQLNLVNRSNTVDDLEKEFADFCKSQKDTDLDMRSRELREMVMGEEAAAAMEVEEAFREKFNLAFDDIQTGKQEVSDERSVLIDEAFGQQRDTQGYGSYMVASEYHGMEVPKYKAWESTDVPAVPLTFGERPRLDPNDTRALVIASNMNIQLGRFFGNARPSLNQCASDYAEAFGPSEPLDPPPDIPGTLDERLERLKAERALLG